MSISVTFHCNGCDAVAGGKSRIRQHFESLYGGGLGVLRVDSVKDVCPDGWVAFDMIGATYCPKCAAEIWPAEVVVAEAEARE